MGLEPATLYEGREQRKTQQISRTREVAGFKSYSEEYFVEFSVVLVTQNFS